MFLLSMSTEEDTIIMLHMSNIAIIFVLSVSPFSSWNLEMYGPKNLLPINNLYNFLELFRYNAAERRRNGVVGKPGITIPKIPKPKDNEPNIINTILIILLYLF